KIIVAHPASVSACATHLRLLEAFVALGEKVQSRAALNGADPDAAWSAFVEHSVLRFFKWLRSTDDGTVEALPPLDVLMVWHAFMLNPRTYANFCKRIAGDQGPSAEGIPWALLDTISPAMWSFEYLQGPEARQVGTETDSFAILLADNMKFDLAAAVHRQRRFALKMIRFGWVHSPVADFILARVVDRYGKFLSLFEGPPATTGTGIGNGRVGMVPTLDIDLVWHTHQLSPASYRAASSTVTGGYLVNHDDTISHGAAKFGFMATAQLYRDRFNEEYDMCSSSKRSCCDRSAVFLCDATSYSGCHPGDCNTDCSGE
ncbi:hypothetical protein QBC37DRAFT_142266, partial [Rhypophila decipiens]